MIRRTLALLAVTLAVLAPSLALAQIQSNPVADRIALKVRKLDLLNQLLPVLMTKEQIRKMLPTIEKARQAEKDQTAKELELMKKYEGKLDAAISAAINKKQVTKIEVLRDLRAMVRGLSISRMAMVGNYTDIVRTKFVEVMNAGQVKAASNALDPRLVEPNADLSKLTSDQKLKLWIRSILLDPLAYDLLVELSK